MSLPLIQDCPCPQEGGPGLSLSPRVSPGGDVPVPGSCQGEGDRTQCPPCPPQELSGFTLDPVAFEDGKGKCPYDPTKGHTGLIVGRCHPWGCPGGCPPVPPPPLKPLCHRRRALLGHLQQLPGHGARHPAQPGPALLHENRVPHLVAQRWGQGTRGGDRGGTARGTFVTPCCFRRAPLRGVGLRARERGQR